MKILMINSVCGIRSTGRICTDLADALTADGHVVRIAYGRESVSDKYQKYAVHIGNDFNVKLHAIESRIFDYSGFGSKKATKQFIKWVIEYDPDVIHLHNIHGYYINVEVLFNYLRTCGKKVIWTLHDCWAFTGHCSYFDYYGCDKWRIGCNNCVLKKDYPQSFLFDRSKANYENKKSAFCGISNLEIVTPSAWLAKLVSESFLSKYSTHVINNGIDINTFKHTNGALKEKYHLNNRKVILGVAAVWNRRKGFEDFLKLSTMIDESHVIILVGLSKTQARGLPNNVIGIERTDSTKELAELYSLSTVYVNPTYEDNYPTTNIEAISCGTPVISYQTGGSGESAVRYGVVVKRGDIVALLEEINRISEQGITIEFDRNNLSINHMVDRYTKLYMK